MRGFTTIELLVAVAVVGVVLASLLGMTTFSLGVSTRLRETTEATALAQEGLEAVRNFRDTVSWNNDDPANQYDGLGVVTLASPYHSELSSDTPARWQLVAGSQTLDQFTRQVVFNAVRRDAASTIAASGGTIDPDTKKATATVTWASGGGTRKVELVTYFTNRR